MNKKEFIERLIDMGGCGAKPETWARGWDDAISEVIGIAEELDEPTKPVIPQFVAEYLDFAKINFSLMQVMELVYTRNEWSKWGKEYDWISANDETFARAWLDGFTVEEEQKYILSISITDKASKTDYETFLNKRGIFHSMENDSFNSEEFNWTEEEIKGLENGEILFEHFATKVEEVSE